MHYTNYSRRNFLKLAGTGLLAATTGLGCSGSEDSDKPERDSLSLYGTGTLDIGDMWDKLQEDLGVRLVFEPNGNDTGPVITQMIVGDAANEYDLGGLQGGAERELANAGTILPWNLDKIPNWEGVWPWVKDISYTDVNGEKYGLPVVINADSMIYLPEKVGKIESYAAVFDDKLKGKTSMEDAWINSVLFTALFMKENNLAQIDNASNLSEDELGVVMNFLIKNKRDGQFARFWSGWEDGLRMIMNEEAYVMTGWEPIVYAAQEKGKNAKYADPKEGYEGWSNDLLLHAGAKEKGIVDLCHKFANWELGGYYGCAVGKQRGYVVPNNSSVKYAKQSKMFNHSDQKELLSDVKSRFLKKKGNVYWQNTRPDNYKLYEEWWSKLRAA